MILDELYESQQNCPECGGPAFSDLLLAEKKDACYHKVRSRYKVWPSAYASGALVQCRKKGAANWGNKSKNESVDEAKSLTKRVKIVKGPHAGKTGWIREIKHGAFKGAPKSYYIDIDGGGQANNLSADSLRLIKEFAPAGSGGGNIPRGPRTPGRDPWSGDSGGDDYYGRPDPRHYARSIDFFGRFEADHFDDEVFDKTTGEFRGYWDDEDGRDQIAYFKFDDPVRTGSDDPGMGWYYEPQNEGLAEGGNVFAPGIENTPAYKAGFSTGKLPVPHPEGTQEYAAYYKGVIDRATPTLNKAVAEDQLDEISADPAYLGAAERSLSQARDTQRQYWRSPEEKAAARRTELKREKGIAGYSKRHKAAHPEMYPKATPRPAPQLRDPSTEYSDDYSVWAAGRRDTMEQGVAEGVEIVDQDSDLDQQVFTLNVDGKTVSFTYWDYENNFQNPDIKDIYQQAREQLGKKLSPEQIKSVARSVFKSFKSGVAEAAGLYGPFIVTINTGERPQSRTKTKKFRREDDAILWAQDWLEDFSQYPFATAEVTDPDGNVVWTTDEEDSPWASAKPGVAEAQPEKIGGRYDPDDFDAMVMRLKQRAKQQEKEQGPVDIAKLAQRLRDIEQKQDRK